MLNASKCTRGLKSVNNLFDYMFELSCVYISTHSSGRPVNSPQRCVEDTKIRFIISGLDGKGCVVFQIFVRRLET
jgi:hypothetical protein